MYVGYITDLAGDLVLANCPDQKEYQMMWSAVEINNGTRGWRHAGGGAWMLERPAVQQARVTQLTTSFALDRHDVLGGRTRLQSFYLDSIINSYGHRQGFY